MSLTHITGCLGGKPPSWVSAFWATWRYLLQGSSGHSLCHSPEVRAPLTEAQDPLLLLRPTLSLAEITATTAPPGSISMRDLPG